MQAARLSWSRGEKTLGFASAVGGDSGLMEKGNDWLSCPSIHSQLGCNTSLEVGRMGHFGSQASSTSSVKGSKDSWKTVKVLHGYLLP